MKTPYACVLASLVISSPLLAAQQSESQNVTTAPGAARAEQTVKVSATVAGIDPATRTISLKRADGQVLDIHAGDEVKNFDKIKVGDRVNAVYNRAISLSLMKGGTSAAKSSESMEVNRAPPGAQPSATVSRQVTVLADVVAVNNKNKLVTLRGPEGHLVDLEVRNPDELKHIKKGDQVQAVYTEALAVAVEPAPGRK